MKYKDILISVLVVERDLLWSSECANGISELGGEVMRIVYVKDRTVPYIDLQYFLTWASFANPRQ